MKDLSLCGLLEKRKGVFHKILRKRIFFQLVTALFLAGCLTPLDRATDYIGGQVVITGQISPLEETSIVHIGRTSGEERLPEPISGVNITVIDDLGNEGYFSEDPQFPGKYSLMNFAGIPGRSYHIRVILPNGQTYESVPERLPSVTGEDVIRYSIEPEPYTDADGVIAERFFVKIYTTHTLAATPDPIFIKWHVHEDYVLSPTDFPDPFGSVPPSCYISQPVDPQRIVLFSSEEAKTSLIPDLLIASRLVDPSFKERHYFTTYQSSMTREAYDYWTKVDIVANQTGSIFDAPPARVKGNLFNLSDQGEEVHGYFQAVNQTFYRFHLLPADLPYRMPVYCEYRADRNYNDYPSACLNCLSVRNSSFNRPPWF